MLFKQYPFIVTKDADGNYVAICEDLNYACTVHKMSLPETCGAVMCAIQQLCDSLLAQKTPLPDASSIETVKRSAPKNTLLVASVIIVRKEEGDPNY